MEAAGERQSSVSMVTLSGLDAEPNEPHCRFDIMAKRLYKTYVNLPNTIIRVSDGTEEGKEHAVLVNAHVDSTLPSPGAADDTAVQP